MAPWRPGRWLPSSHGEPGPPEFHTSKGKHTRAEERRSPSSLSSHLFFPPCTQVLSGTIAPRRNRMSGAPELPRDMEPQSLLPELGKCLLEPHGRATVYVFALELNGLGGQNQSEDVTDYFRAT